MTKGECSIAAILKQAENRPHYLLSMFLKIMRFDSLGKGGYPEDDFYADKKDDTSRDATLLLSETTVETMKEPFSKSIRTLCIPCTHFFVTWDRCFPYGCKALGFRSKKRPSLVVYESSGMECQYFKAKKRETAR